MRRLNTAAIAAALLAAGTVGAVAQTAPNPARTDNAGEQKQTGANSSPSATTPQTRGGAGVVGTDRPQPEGNPTARQGTAEGRHGAATAGSGSTSRRGGHATAGSGTTGGSDRSAHAGRQGSSRQGGVQRPETGPSTEDLNRQELNRLRGGG